MFSLANAGIADASILVAVGSSKLAVRFAGTFKLVDTRSGDEASHLQDGNSSGAAAAVGGSSQCNGENAAINNIHIVRDPEEYSRGSNELTSTNTPAAAAAPCRPPQQQQAWQSAEPMHCRACSSMQHTIAKQQQRKPCAPATTQHSRYAQHAAASCLGSAFCAELSPLEH